MSAVVSNVKASVLIVDDEAAHLNALHSTLQDAGYDATSFRSPFLALAALRTHSVHLVITDLKMPELDGISFLRAAQEIDRNLVGIVMTGHGTMDTAIEAMKAGALDYILKPFTLSALTPVLLRALEIRRLRTEVVQLQERVSEHVVELEAANKELEAFSHSVSHDLRAPLRAISGFSTILAETYAAQLPDDARQLFSRITFNAERMGELIEHLLRFSHLSRQSLDKQRVEMAALVQQVIAELQKEQSAGHVEVHVDDLPDVIGDPFLLRQVFANLLSNAFKFSRKKEQPRVVVSYRRQGKENIYFVRDNGAGFDMRHADNLFRVFHRLHHVAEFEGTGVGLSLAQRIIERHGGRIWTEAAVDQGATFYFSLPQRQQKAKAD